MEGTTTNGKGLANFKKGAFILNKPLWLYSIKYESNSGNGFTIINLFNHILC